MNDDETHTDEEGGLMKSLHALTGTALFTSVGHCVLGCIGIPLNAFIVYVIITSEELRNQTRFVLFLGMLIGNIFFYATLFNEVAYQFSSLIHHCKIIRFLRGLPVAIFVINYLLVLVDYYVAVTRSALHRRRFTVWNVVPCQIGLSILVCVVAKLLYIVGTVPLDCRPKPSFLARMFAIAIMAVLVIPCAIFMILVFLKSNQITPLTPDQVIADDSMTQVGSVNSDSGNSSTLIETDEDEAKPTMTADQIRIRVANAKRERDTVHAIMILCTAHAIAILYIPQILFDFSIFVCLKTHSSEKEKCDFLERMRPFVTEFAALYGIIQPVIFLWLCDQFWFAWDNRN